ncbi:hypothetical protein HRbin41_00299 [bacterium HR41]|nr:hypothetical protein HRbin41_00299 [bacterium HR41]
MSRSYCPESWYSRSRGRNSAGAAPKVLLAGTTGRPSAVGRAPKIVLPPSWYGTTGSLARAGSAPIAACPAANSTAAKAVTNSETPGDDQR